MRKERLTEWQQRANDDDGQLRRKKATCKCSLRQRWRCLSTDHCPFLTRLVFAIISNISASFVFARLNDHCLDTLIVQWKSERAVSPFTDSGQRSKGWHISSFNWIGPLNSHLQTRFLNSFRTDAGQWLSKQLQLDHRQSAQSYSDLLSILHLGRSLGRQTTERNRRWQRVDPIVFAKSIHKHWAQLTMMNRSNYCWQALVCLGTCWQMWLLL